ncbi:MAG: restriction endonuclease, partial [Acidobacteria bacterium]
CIEAISEKEFRLERVYKFEDILQVKHPQNNFIRDKIRQQLQVLRDKGVIEFISRGMYRKL